MTERCEPLFLSIVLDVVGLWIGAWGWSYFYDKRKLFGAACVLGGFAVLFGGWGLVIWDDLFWSWGWWL